MARKVADGRIEFGLQQRLADNSWSDRMLPSRRFFPTTATVGHWLVSSPLTLGARIVARKVADGRIEFGLQQRLADNSWSDRMLPSRRFFPTTATVGRWLVSSPLTLRTGAAESEPASSVGVDGNGHAACRPRGIHNDTVGFPLPPVFLRATGTVRVAVLFLDFPNAEATHTTRQESASALAHIETYLEGASYGRLDLQFEPLHRWLRAEHDYDEYNLDGQSIWDGRRWVTVGVTPQAEAVRLADPHLDFTGYGMALVVMPSSHFWAGAAGVQSPPLTTAEDDIAHAPVVNSWVRSDRPGEPFDWGDVMAHEMAHSFGLADLYPHIVDRPERPASTTWAYARFGLMGLDVYYPAIGDNASYVTHPEMLAWSRWQLGWLTTGQVRCVTEGDATVVLSPVADPGDGTAMAAIPLSDTEVIVVESRRRIGYDDIPWGSDGVLVYTVDSTLDSGALPLKIGDDTGSGTIDRSPFLTEGESLSLRGYTITVRSATSTADTVVITRSG
ncbi:MAG: hypothetical protein F4121_09275 [Acidimicrobiia bacterium]|nr:hypothetical protein [Acidimicrobiia bacterium]MYI20239.1 hypothetical protein [Acidimicrobiia bacterium]